MPRSMKYLSCACESFLFFRFPFSFICAIMDVPKYMFGKLQFIGQGPLPMRAFDAEEIKTPLGTTRPVASFALRIVSCILISPVRRADTSDQSRMP